MIIGHKKQWQYLLKSKETGRLSHAYLFCGQEKLGKKKVALEWISLLLGEDVFKNSHPDLTLIEPEGKEIQIGQIKQLIWNLSLKPYSAPFKIALIDRAHLMNEEAQASLLKTLEEPKGETILVLVSEEPKYLLPTIVSRVQTIKFYPVAREEITGYLTSEGLAEKESEEVFKISLGSPGLAVDYVTDPQKLGGFKKKESELTEISKSALHSRFQYAKDLAEDPKNLKDTLDVWMSYLREVLLSKVKTGKEEGSYSISKLKNILLLIQDINYLISNTNVNSRLALEKLMLEL